MFLKLPPVYTHMLIVPFFLLQVFLLPSLLARKRLWNMKYPICIVLAEGEEGEEEDSTEEAFEGEPRSDRQAALSQPSQPTTLFLFGRTGREKEEWFQNFLRASKMKSHSGCGSQSGKGEHFWWANLIIWCLILHKILHNIPFHDILFTAGLLKNIYIPKLHLCCVVTQSQLVIPQQFCYCVSNPKVPLLPRCVPTLWLQWISFNAVHRWLQQREHWPHSLSATHEGSGCQHKRKDPTGLQQLHNTFHCTRKCKHSSQPLPQ